MSDLWAQMAAKFDRCELAKEESASYLQWWTLMAVVHEYPNVVPVARYAELVGREEKQVRSALDALVADDWMTKAPGRHNGPAAYKPNFIRICSMLSLTGPATWKIWRRTKFDLWQQDVTHREPREPRVLGDDEADLFIDRLFATAKELE